ALPDIDTLSAAEYQRILAIWRLLAISHGADLDELISRTLRAVLPLLRADRAALWRQAEGAWTRPAPMYRTKAAPGAELEVTALIERAATTSDVEVLRDEHGVRAVAIGLRSRDSLDGVLEVSAIPGALRAQASDLRFLSSLAQQVGRVLGEMR